MRRNTHTTGRFGPVPSTSNPEVAHRLYSECSDEKIAVTKVAIKNRRGQVKRSGVLLQAQKTVTIRYLLYIDSICCVAIVLECIIII